MRLPTPPTMVSDPLSGLFMFRTAAVDAARLSPAASRILLEILVRHPATRVTEVAYRAPVRPAAQSRGALRQGARFLGHLAQLPD